MLRSLNKRADDSGDEDGGYDYEFIDNIPHKYICSICTKVMRDARLVECCGQHFCKYCLNKWLNKKNRDDCPFCRTVMFRHVQNKEKIREIKELRIRCINRKKGCEWVGELGTLQNHLQSDSGCCFVIVRCSNSANKWEVHATCGAEIERRYLADHEQNKCKYRNYECEHCGYIDTYDAVAGSAIVRLGLSKVKYGENHYRTCENYPLACVNHCGEENIKRKDMESHRNICTHELRDCPYQCGDKVRRGRMVRHKIHCPYRPFECLYCKKTGTYGSITGQGSFLRKDYHYKVCQLYPLDCPNQCGAKGIKRKDIQCHRDKCLLEPLDCPFKFAKCSMKILRSNMDSHCEKSVKSHLLLMAKTQQELMIKCDELSKENEQLRQKNDKLTQKMEDICPSSQKRARIV